MELEITSMAGGGAGVARCDGKVWFVRGALPGELVEARPVRSRAGIVEAEAVAVLRAGAQRDPDPCPVAGECGGCSLAHVRREAAADVLRAVAAGGLRHAPRALAEAVEGAAVTVSPYRSRLRARLHWEPAERRLGFFATRSHRVVGLEPCRVISERLQAALPGMAAALTGAGLPAGEVVWLEDLAGTSGVAGWGGDAEPPPGQVDGLDGWWQVAGRRRRGWGADSVTMDLPLPLVVPIGVFFQANRVLVPRLFARVAELTRSAGWSSLLDLYAGVGFLAAAGRHGGATRVVAVEADATSAGAARRNLPGADVQGRTAESFVGSSSERFDVAIVDAPRSGMTEAARSGVVALDPAAVLVLACDVATFGRDAATFLAAGYSPTLLELWDLFAGSHHVEILALFER